MNSSAASGSKSDDYPGLSEMVVTDAVLHRLLETVWMFIDHRGAVRKQYASSVELSLMMCYLSEAAKDEKTLVRMVRVGDAPNQAWEYGDKKDTFEFADGTVTMNGVKSPLAREKLVMDIVATLSMCGIPSEKQNKCGS